MSSPGIMVIPSKSSITISKSTGTMVTSTQRTTTPVFEQGTSEGGEMGHLVTTDLESIFVTPTEPMEADVAEYLRIFDAIQVPITAIELKYMYNLTPAEDYENFLLAQPATDPQDLHVKRVLFGDLDLGWYRTSFHKYCQYIPQEGTLQEVDPEFVPYQIRDIRCLAIKHNLLLPFTLTTDTLIPAGIYNG
ncbi:hypothetical protein BDP27DRAFT_1419530 [Rhodocollybia butyracea]|uniref:Uncharacterized protein n=1 Tax=Rhodocollybia butyracea TaxID=206335 RepID=A0A9P5UAF0_9AGAR|nr:hypothetical protein BDP27DRAFT_1419530 [Rhodocollybia butyracea]